MSLQQQRPCCYSPLRHGTTKCLGESLALAPSAQAQGTRCHDEALVPTRERSSSASAASRSSRTCRCATMLRRCTSSELAPPCALCRTVSQAGFFNYAAYTRRGTACGGGRQMVVDYPQGGAGVSGAVTCGGSAYGRCWRCAIVVGGRQSEVLRVVGEEW